MTKQDRQKLSILTVLVAVLGLTLWMVYRMGPPTTAAVQVLETAAANSLPTANNTRIRMDIVDEPEGSDGDVGRKDLFRYRQAPPPPAPVAKPGASDTMPAVVAPPPVPRAPAPPPPPPPIPLQYQGFAIDKSAEGGHVAFLAEGPSKHYNVTVGEVLMGRYRVVRISDTSVEIEDLEYNRRQTLPLLK